MLFSWETEKKIKKFEREMEKKCLVDREHIKIGRFPSILPQIFANFQFFG